MLTRFSHQEETDRPPGRSLLWSRRSARCCSPAGCLPQNASCPLDQPEQRDRQTHSRVSVYPNEKTYRRLEKATPPRPPLPWPGRKKTAKWFNVLRGGDRVRGREEAYVCGGGAAGEKGVRLSVRHLRQLLLILLLDGRRRGSKGAAEKKRALFMIDPFFW